MSFESPLRGRAAGPAADAAGADGAGRCRSPADPPERGRLHELHAASVEDLPAAAAAALLMAGTAAGEAPLAWARTARAERSARLHAPGLAALGLDPARMLLAVLPDDLALLKAGAELLKSAAFGAVLLEFHGACRLLDLTATRRLALAAAAGNAAALLLRAEARPQPSAAWRRWSVAARPSAPLAARAPGAPGFAFELLKDRAGPAGGATAAHWRPGRLATGDPADAASLSRLPFSLPAGGSLPAGRRAA